MTDNTYAPLRITGAWTLATYYSDFPDWIANPDDSVPCPTPADYDEEYEDAAERFLIELGWFGQHGRGQERVENRRKMLTAFAVMLERFGPNLSDAARRMAARIPDYVPTPRKKG